MSSSAPGLAALGPTGDIAISGGCYKIAQINAYVARYNALGKQVAWLQPYSGGTGSFWTNVAFDPNNHLLASFVRMYVGDEATIFIDPVAQNGFAYASVNDLHGLGGDALGSYFYVATTTSPTPISGTSLQLPGSGTYLVRGGTQGDGLLANFSGNYVPDRTGGILRFGALTTTLDVGCGAMTPGASTGYVARIDPSWGCTYSHALPVAPQVLATADGGAILSATASTALDLGCGALPAAANGSTFVTRLDPQGACVFGKALPAPNLAVAIDPAGRILVSGSVDVASVDLGGGPLASIGAQDFVLAELDAAGNHLWSRRLGGAGVTFTYPRARTTASGDVYFKTSFTGAADLGGGTLTAAGSDIVVASFSPSGAHRWSRAIHVIAAASSAIDECGALVVVSGASSFNPGCGTVLPPATNPPTPYAPNVAIARFAP
jgi:hypothetical protein